MEPSEFIGRSGSRERAVDKVLKFLDESAPGYLIVYGTWAIGKSKVIDKAFAERPEIYEVLRSKRYVRLNLGTLLAMIDEHRHKRRKSRFEDPGTDYISRLIEGLEKELGPQKQIVFWISVSQVEDNHTSLEELLQAHGKNYSGPPRKFIFELQRDQPIKLRANPRGRNTVRVEGFFETEVEDYLRACLGETLGLGNAERSRVIRRQVCRIIGRHPGLLQVLCEKIGEFNEERLAALDALSLDSLDRSFHEFAMDLIDISESMWEDCIHDVLATLSPSARMAVQDQKIHSELEIDGLAFRDGERRELIFLLSRFGSSFGDSPSKPPTGGIAKPPSDRRNRPRLFISYSFENSEIAHRIKHDLEIHGVDVWISTKMRVGDRIPLRVFKAISQSDFFVVVWSKDAAASRWVEEEVNAAFTRALSRPGRYQILPILTDECPLPEYLDSRLAADFCLRYEDGLGELLRAIEGISDQQVA